MVTSVPLTILLTFIAMTAFAANSLLARAALAGNAIDAGSFTAIRILSGALALAALLVVRDRRNPLRPLPGRWISAIALLVYALAFSLAYLRLSTAAGALILFASVQGSMIGWGVLHRDRPAPAELTGLAVAFGGFVYLLLPGLGTPDLPGSLLMILSGAAWGAYSLVGRGVRDPLGATAGNFMRAAPCCLPLVVWALWAGHATAAGIVLAMTSGIVTSGLGYAIWYHTLPRLSTTQAATVQLTVPILAGIGAVTFLTEMLTQRLVVAAVCVLGGVAFTILRRRRAG